MDDAIARANALPYAFHAAVFTRDIDTAMRCYHRLDAAAVIINDAIVSRYKFDTGRNYLLQLFVQILGFAASFSHPGPAGQVIVMRMMEKTQKGDVNPHAV